MEGSWINTEMVFYEDQKQMQKFVKDSKGNFIKGDFNGSIVYQQKDKLPNGKTRLYTTLNNKAPLLNVISAIHRIHEDNFGSVSVCTFEKLG